MLLAIAVFLLHAPAVPQNSISAASHGVAEASAATTSADASASLTLASAKSTELSAEGSFDVSSGLSPRGFALGVARPESDAAVAFLPGRLVPERAPSASRALPVSELTASILPASAPAFVAVLPPPSASAAILQLRIEQQALRHRRRQWLALAIASHSAAAFDGWATRDAIANKGGSELNPLLQPFAGNSSLYAAIQVGPAILDFAGRRMLSSRYAWMRNTWWIPQVVGTAMSLGSGAHNLAIHASPAAAPLP